MLIHTTEAERLRDERRVTVKVNRPTHHINWEEINTTSRNVIEQIEDAVVEYLRQRRGYPATHHIVGEQLIKARFKSPVILNGRALAGVIRHLADRQYFELVRRVEVNGRMTDFLWAGCSCHHDVWQSALKKMAEGKRVRLKA